MLVMVRKRRIPECDGRRLAWSHGLAYAWVAQLLSSKLLRLRLHSLLVLLKFLHRRRANDSETIGQRKVRVSSLL